MLWISNVDCCSDETSVLAIYFHWIASSHRSHAFDIIYIYFHFDSDGFIFYYLSEFAVFDFHSLQDNRKCAEARLSSHSHIFRWLIEQRKKTFIHTCENKNRKVLFALIRDRIDKLIFLCDHFFLVVSTCSCRRKKIIALSEFNASTVAKWNVC